MSRKSFITLYRGETYNMNALNIKNEPLTPDGFTDNYEQLDVSFENICGQMKKSLSMSDVATIKDDLINLKYQDDKDEIYARYRRPTNSNNNQLCKNKFVSVAEAIYHFQRDTPDRFHTTRSSNYERHDRPLKLTRPQSPVLLSRARSRPRCNILSQKEKEEMEIEELKKFKIKAHPIPKSVIEGSRNLPDVPRKPSTIPEPFKLTEMVRKPICDSPYPVFKARPVPKNVLEKPQLPAKAPVSITKPVSPKFRYKISNLAKKNMTLKEHNGQKSEKDKPKQMEVVHVARQNGKIHPIPFSFEKRDETLKRRKEEKIKHQIELEKQTACHFKAKPVPGMVKRNMRCLTAKSNVSSASSENKENYHFEARPPAVLYKKPFKPELPLTEPTQPVGFDLSTNKRALERQEFENHLKEKEEQMEQIRQEKEKELLEIEKKQIADLRAQLVHHPKPVCIKSPYVPQKSLLPITYPETPKFVRRLKQKSAK